jgi:septal ring factor EnvC (AmiA/AmiB activator)
MTDVTNELMYEVLKAIQTRLAGVDGKVDELKQEMQAFRTHMVRLQQDIGSIHATLVRHEARLGRIESRLELTDVPLP